MHAQIKHRDRFNTAPKLNRSGQPVRADLSGHQPHILRALAEHDTLTVYDIHAIVGGNLRALRASVRRLKDQPNEYIQILPELRRNRNYRQNLHYQLTPKGVEYLNSNGTLAHTPRRVYNLGHTGLVSHIMASIASGIGRQVTSRFVSWEEMQQHPKFPPETITANDNTAIAHAKGHIRPDTHPFGIENIREDGKKVYRFLVVEADNGTETIKPTRPEQYNGSSIYAKFEAYLDFIETKGFHKRYGLPNYFVLFVFTSRSRLDNAKALLASMRREGSPDILFQLANYDAPAGYIFTTPCECVGYSPVQLDRP